MKVIYMGTPLFAVGPLEALIKAGHEICTVVTQPDKPNSRRGKEIIFSPVKQLAIEKDIPVFQPKDVFSLESEQHLASFDADVIIACAFGQILKSNILNLTPHGCINIHASLLPKYRGAAPIHRSIINGEKETGVTIMYMDEGLDSGDMMICMKTPITNEMTVGELHDKLSELGSELIVEALQLLQEGNAPRIKQVDNDSTYADKIKKSDCEINFECDAGQIYNMIRGLNPYPGAYTYFNGKIIKLYDLKISEKCYNKKAGCLVGITDDRLIVACKNGSLLLETVKPEGKRLMKASAFWAGLHDKESLVFGTKGE